MGSQVEDRDLIALIPLLNFAVGRDGKPVKNHVP
jgi:hypothetical protein